VISEAEEMTLGLVDLVVALIAAVGSLPHLLMIFSGCLLFILLYYETPYWKQLGNVNKTLWLVPGIALGLVVGILIVIPILQLLQFWSGHYPADVSWPGAVTVAFVTLLAFVMRFFGETSASLLRYASMILILVTAFCVMSVIAVTIVSFAVPSYPPQVAILVEEPWSRFRWATLGLWFPALVSGVLYVFVAKTLRTINLDQSVPILRIRMRGRHKGTPNIVAKTRRLRQNRNLRLFLAGVLLVCLASWSVVPFDKQFGLFTPEVTVGHEAPYSLEGCPTEGRIVLVRYHNGTYRFYQIHRMPYVVRMPLLGRLVDRLYIQSPSNFTTDPIWLDSMVDVFWAQGSKNVSFSLLGTPGPVTGVLVHLAQVPGPTANFTLFYSKQFLHRNVAISETNSTEERGRTYHFSFTNHENVCLYLSRIDLVELRRQEANITGAVAYIDGVPAKEIVIGADGIHLMQWLYSGRTMNVTVTLPMKES